MSAPEVPSAALRARVLASATAEPVRRTRARIASALVLGLACSFALGVFLARGGVRITGRPESLVGLTAGGAAAITFLIAWLALARGRSMLGRSTPALLAVVVLAPLALLAWKLATTMGQPGMMRFWPERLGWRCLRLSLAISAAPLTALILLRRGKDPVHPIAWGAVMGAAVGAFSWTLVDLWCPVAYVPHLLLGHVLPLVLVTGAGALMGRLLLAPRAT